MNRRTLVVATLTATVAAHGCGDSGTEPGPGAPASLVIASGALELFVPESRQLVARVEDANGRSLDATVNWTMGDPAVASVNGNGEVTAVGVGTTHVEARVGSLADSVPVQVLETLQLVFPLEGVLNTDFYYVNYVDLRSGPGILDYRCGPKSYDGHHGVDLTLPSFERMDEGVRILAAAPGTVTQIADGVFDRSTTNGPGGFGNHVRLQHRDGFESIYGHMARSSVAVSLGQSVEAGQVLGLVGSSGNSDMPHLHVEFLRYGSVVDAFAGECGDVVDHWAAADPYQDEFGLIQSRLTTADLTLDLVKAPVAHTSTFSTDDVRFSAWVHLANVREGSTSRFDLFDPDGGLFWTYSFTHDRFWAMSWWWVWRTLQGSMTVPGTWRLEYRNDGNLLAEHDFELVEAAASAVNRAPAGSGGPAAGMGGGGLGAGGMAPGPRRATGPG
ncbi:MAG: peptidoglycan DD-metalloendopeptidase family protein [Gemmatimonadales bacterium]|jgi:murein DD-endopeptidase MepM/ murein hydrolase activator NlpD|nr:MAG: peptidoglycan DD-metalloendopeptidase family protein [Gemmatimonadales bacterium]